MSRASKYLPELRERVVRLARTCIAEKQRESG